MRPALIVPVAAVLLAVAGCSKTADTGKLEQSIEDEAERVFEGYDVSEADCPEDIEIEQGNDFDCTIGVAGVDVRVHVTQNDDDGNVTLDQLDAVIDVNKAEAVLADQIGQQAGVTIEVDCGGDDYLAVEVGGGFACEATDGADSRTVDVTVTDAAGNVEFELR